MAKPGRMAVKAVHPGAMLGRTAVGARFSGVTSAWTKRVGRVMVELGGAAV